MHERDIRPEHILTYEAPKDYAVYAASVVIKPDIKISKTYAYANSKEGWSLIKHLCFAPRYDIGERAFELNSGYPNPSKLMQAYQDCLENLVRYDKQSSKGKFIMIYRGIVANGKQNRA